MKNLFNRLFGFRWSVYIVRDGNHLVYALHEHCPIALTSYVMGYFEGGQEPVPPWSLFLNYNRQHKSFQLHSYHFQADGKRQSSELIERIEELDPNWRNRRPSDPVFVEVATKKRLKVSDISSPFTARDFQKMIDNAGKPPETTYYSVMDEVFGRRSLT